MKFCPGCGGNVENITDKCPKCGFDIAGCLKETDDRELERRKKDQFLFTENHYGFANPDYRAEGNPAEALMPIFAQNGMGGMSYITGRNDEEELSTVTGQSGMEAILRLNPVFKEMVWGGNRLRTEFGYDIPGDDTGECWAISAHKHGDCTINGGKYDGKTLSWLWENVPQLFGRQPAQAGPEQSEDCFPLLIKIIDAKRDLSIQVHPDDEYARVHENGSKGKTECWYILDCDPGATIIIGHNAKTHEDLENMIAENRWNELLREIPIKKGDFFQIFPGTVHAIKGGTMILETQQNSDVTYRVYDYGRLQNGRPRELHIRQSLDVIGVPFDPASGYAKGRALAGADNEPLVSCDRYKVWHLKCRENSIYHNDGKGYMLCSVIGGEGAVTVLSQPEPLQIPKQQENTQSPSGRSVINVRKGDHFILTAGFTSFTTTGNFEMICSVPGCEN